jgi:hypothetical protein
VPAVSDSAWASFLAEVVTPRFSSGFTSWAAQGQWRAVGGELEHENSFVLELVHLPDRISEQSVGVIMAEYKRRFHQDSVLRVRSRAKASY